MLHNSLSCIVANLHAFCYLIFYLVICTIFFIKTFQKKKGGICPNAYLLFIFSNTG